MNKEMHKNVHTRACKIRKCVTLFKKRACVHYYLYFLFLFDEESAENTGNKGSCKAFLFVVFMYVV